MNFCVVEAGVTISRFEVGTHKTKKKKATRMGGAYKVPVAGPSPLAKSE